MFAGLLVVLLVEPAYQVLEDGAHGVVVQAGQSDGAVFVLDRVGTEVDVWRKEPVDEGAEGVAFRQAVELVAELELIEDVLDVVGVAVQVRLKVGAQRLLGGTGRQVAHRERRRIVEGVFGCLLQDTILVSYAGVVEPFLFIEHLLLGGFQYGIKAPQYRHGQDDVAVLAAHVEVAQNVVGNGPD